MVWAESIEIAKKHFPEVIASGILPVGGVVETARRMIDGGEGGEGFEMKMRRFEEQVISFDWAIC